MYELIKHYHNDNQLRKSFNELAKRTFSLDFEDWYQNGYWREDYIPYSIMHNGIIVANVSVNIIDMMWNGKGKHFLQLGTVMTDEKYRNQGFIRRIINEIEQDYAHQVDGMYLYANDSVVEFYPKFGYQKANEYQYTKSVTITSERRVRQVSMENKKDWDIIESAIENRIPFSSFELINNIGLYMFYLTQFMKNNVYYDEITKAYVVSEIENEEVLIHSIFSTEKVDLDDVIEAFGNEINRVVLGFVPPNKENYTVTEIIEENTTFFVKGKVFIEFEKEKLRFPTLAHA